MSASPQPLALDLTTTLDDQVALLRHMFRQPSLARMRLRRELLFILLSPICIVLGGVVAWLLDPHANSAAVLLKMFSDPLTVIEYFGGAMIIMTLAMGVSRLDTRRRIRTMIKRHLLARPDVDPKDATLSHRTRVTFDAHGISNEISSGSSVTHWSVVRQLVETEDRFFLFAGPLNGFVLPKRALTPAQTADFRRLVAHYMTGEPLPA